MSLLIKNKKVSETPLQLASKIKSEIGAGKISYCGKLDPMSRGLMLFLTDDFCKHQEKYLKFDKIYEFKILFGVETDTYDILGKITNFENNNRVNIKEIINYSKTLIGKHKQSFPPYSSICVKNSEGLRQPLWWWSKNNRLTEINIPSKEIEIYSFEYIKEMEKTFDEIYQTLTEKINKLDGDFRQEEILTLWNNYYNKNKDKKFHILKFRTHVSSGTYIRNIIQDIAKKFNTSAIAYDINRKKIGEYSITE